MAVPRLSPTAHSCVGFVASLLGGLWLLVLPAMAEEAKMRKPPFTDEPAAHALYNQMIDALHQAKSLSFAVHYEREAKGHFKSGCTYRVWLKKPNYFRMETQALSGKQGGVLIGDGDNLWIHWPNGRPQWKYVVESEADKKTRFTSYMTKPTPLGKHSIWHEADFLNSGMSFPILDVSTFHGHVDSAEPYVNAVRSRGSATIGGEDCDQIEVSLFGHQREWTLWISQRDHLPRKLKEIAHVSYDIVTQEEWTAVTLNGEIPSQLFIWKPPAGWTQWRLPSDEDHLLQPGAKAPDFDLASPSGERLRLSNFRGKTVWLCFWRVGCPPCLEELPHLQELYTKFRDKGLVVLAVDVSDDRTFTVDYLRKHGITFPNALDTSPAAQKVCEQDYGGGTVPMNYLINADGLVVDAWFGFSPKTQAREKAALIKMRPEWAAFLP